MDRSHFNFLFYNFFILNTYIKIPTLNSAGISHKKENVTIHKKLPYCFCMPFFLFIPLEQLDFVREVFILFFLFLAVLFSLLVLVAQNPIFSALALMSTYVFSGFLLICFGLEIYGIYFILIYAGAISVLILFVVMMINLRFKEKPQPKTSVWYILKLGLSFLIILTSITAHFSIEYMANYLGYTLFGIQDLIDIDALMVLEMHEELIKISFLFPKLFSNTFLFIISLSLLILLIGMVGASFLVLSARKPHKNIV